MPMVPKGDDERVALESERQDDERVDEPVDGVGEDHDHRDRLAEARRGLVLRRDRDEAARAQEIRQDHVAREDRGQEDDERADRRGCLHVAASFLGLAAGRRGSGGGGSRSGRGRGPGSGGLLRR